MDTCPHCGCELVDPKEHSDPLRKMFFATIRDIWQTLPDHFAEIYPSSEHLRKAALIRAGWCETVTTACNDKQTALRVAALAKHLDRYAIARVEGSTVMVFTARSIARRACKKAELSKVVEDALRWARGLVGIEEKAA